MNAELYRWHSYFAWKPMRLPDGRLAWWEFIERRRLPYGGWEFRRIATPEQDWGDCI